MKARLMKLGGESLPSVVLPFRFYRNALRRFNYKHAEANGQNMVIRIPCMLCRVLGKDNCSTSDCPLSVWTESIGKSPRTREGCMRWLHEIASFNETLVCLTPKSVYWRKVHDDAAKKILDDIRNALLALPKVKQ